MTTGNFSPERILSSFGRQGLMATFDVKIVQLAQGAVHLRAPIRPATSQQHGAAHAGLTFALGDSAAGYSALGLMPEGVEVMTSEMKIHLLRPAVGAWLEARGSILRHGRRLTVAQADIFALGEDMGAPVLVAHMLGTMVPVDPA